MIQPLLRQRLHSVQLGVSVLFKVLLICNSQTNELPNVAAWLNACCCMRRHIIHATSQCIFMQDATMQQWSAASSNIG